MRAARILVADDHAIFREGLSHIVGAEPGVQIVGSVVCVEEAVALTRELKPDVVMLGLNTPRGADFDLVARIAREVPAVRIIVLAAAVDRTQTVDLLRQGARGVVLKNCATNLLHKCIRRVMAGEYWVGRDLVPDLVRALIESRAAASGQAAASPFALTRREREILSLIVAGCTNKDVAARCSIGEDTVKHHLTSIFDKTGAANRLELVLLAIDRGVVEAA